LAVFGYLPEFSETFLLKNRKHLNKSVLSLLQNSRYSLVNWTVLCWCGK